METVWGEKLKKLKDDLGLSSYADLGLAVGMAGQTINNYRTETRKTPPEPLVCLLFAGVSVDPEDRAYWIRASGLDAKQLRVIREGLGIRVSADDGIADLLANPRDAEERALANLVRVHLRYREILGNNNV